ncbi:MAG TPA: [Fe-Fe] hydrogenase large subunit C-terminal domain-containing protein [Atribacteraceae bacterium]|nr:[Fe-Fe] hydrogenase large subunit C-terminal domain-containing protein [Atribacteraceae bacterium]
MGVITTEKTSCRDCYKCIRHCPVKAIRLNMGHAEIVDERCIKDGQCALICPQGAKKIQNDRPIVQEYFDQGEFVVASLAPSFVASFPAVRPDQVVAALKKLGFNEVRETAEAAEQVAIEHAALLREGRENIIASSCPAVNALIYIYYPHLIPYLAPVVSPMIGHARMIRKEFSPRSIRIVFIGPCLAKKAEKNEQEVFGEVDTVLTFEEIYEWFEEAGIEPAKLSGEPVEVSRTHWARAFPVEGGLLKATAMETGILSKDMLALTGIDRCRRFLDGFEKERSGFRIMEMMSCEGGCIDGPIIGSKISLFERRRKIIEYAEQESRSYSENADRVLLPDFRRDFTVRNVHFPLPSEEELKRILTLTGKFTIKDELNCGACGYDACREKAVAVYQGLAEAEMCIPHMRARAESFSSFLITVTPNGIILIDENLRIVDMNPALRTMLSLQGKVVIGKTVQDLFDPSPFVGVLRTKKALTKETHYSQYHNLIVKLSVFYLEKSRLLMGVFVDLTREREQEKSMENIREKTLANAQQVVTNQMMVAQEIAGLLGETTAETKTLLSKLGKIIRGETVEE